MPRYIDAEKVNTNIVWMPTANQMFKEELNRQKTADVAPVVHAHWEWITENKYRCSCCYTQTRVDEVMGKPIYRVCPYCAAFMDEEE